MAISQELENVLLGRMGSTTAGAEISTLLNTVEDTIGTIYYADSTATSSGAGTLWSTAFKTIAEAVTAAVAGDVILLKGSFNEAVTCAKAGVRFIGIGTGPGQAVWTAPTVDAGSTACLTLTAAYCEVRNIKIRPVAYSSSGAPSGINLSTGANYTRIIGNRFQGKAGSYVAVRLTVGVDNVLIEDNEFIYMNTLTYGAAIKGAFTASGWIIRNNIFNSCVIAIEIEGRSCVIENNVIMVTGLAAAGTFGGAVCTKGIDLTGTDTGANKICGNHLGGVYSVTLYIKGGTGDEWAGNWTTTVTGTITNAAGMTLTATA